MIERSQNREPPLPPKGAASMQGRRGLVAYSIISDSMTLDERRAKFFSCFYPKRVDGSLGVTNIMDSPPKKTES